MKTTHYDDFNLAVQTALRILPVSDILEILETRSKNEVIARVPGVGYATSVRLMQTFKTARDHYARMKQEHHEAARKKRLRDAT